MRREQLQVMVAVAMVSFGCTKRNPEYCENDGECEAGMVCDLDLHTCSDDSTPDASPGTADAPMPDVDAGGGECAVSSDCTNASAPICDDADQVCRGCTSGTECAARDSATPACADDGRCVECTSHDDCASEVCDIVTETCIAAADVIYVDVSGSTSSGCGSKVNRCRTFTLAVGEVSGTRNVIKANPGLYNAEPDTILVDGIALTVIADGAVLDAIAANGITVQNGATLEVRGLAIQNAGAAAIRCETGSDITVKLLDASLRTSSRGFERGFNCTTGLQLILERTTVTANSFGIIMDGNVSVSESRIEGNSNDGLLISGFLQIDDSVIAANGGRGVSTTATTVAIRRSLIADNTDGGLLHENGDVLVRNSFLIGNGGTGAISVSDFDPAGTTTIEFNTIANGTGTGAQVRCEVDGTVTAANNIVRNNAGTPNVTDTCNFRYSNVEGGATGEGNIDLPPLFVASDNFHIQGDSPCRNAADPAATVSVDFDGDARPEGGRADMGADEFVP